MDGDKVPSLLNDQASADVIIRQICGDQQTDYFAHRLILSSQSLYFRTMFNSAFKEGQVSDSGLSVIPMHEDDPDLFRIMLKFIYEADYDHKEIVELSCKAEAEAAEPMTDMAQMAPTPGNSNSKSTSDSTAIAERYYDKVTQLEFHIGLYHIGDKYLIGRLQREAVAAFTRDAKWPKTEKNDYGWKVLFYIVSMYYATCRRAGTAMGLAIVRAIKLLPPPTKKDKRKLMLDEALEHFDKFVNDFASEFCKTLCRVNCIADSCGKPCWVVSLNDTNPTYCPFCSAALKPPRGPFNDW